MKTLGGIVELILNREVLAEAVAWSSRTISQRPAVPVMAGVHIAATSAGVEFASYDYNVSARVTVEPLELITEGTVVVDGKLLSETARALPNKISEVSFKTEDNYLHITCGSFHQQLLVMPEEDYPQLPQLPQVVGQVDAEVFSHSISQVSIAASRDETLPLLTGISLEIRPEKLCVLATDRYRMALKEIPWQATNPQINQDLVVKAKNIADAAKNIASSGSISLAVDGEDESSALVGLSAGGRLFTSQVNDGNYPDVRRIFPEPINIVAVVKVSDFVAAAKRVAIVSANLSNQQITLSFTQGTLEFRAGSGGENTATDAIPVQLNGADISVSFNSRMLIEGLSVVDEPYVRLSFKDETKPVIITGQKEETGDDSLDFQYLIMPIRTAI
ncbi:DNA polymerase III subunit beta [Mobiluncus mulieris]|nr:DNA polymerase III subunit beta [Mobiluncus mulieris]